MVDSVPERIGERYRVVRLLGRGGMGVVYEVEHAHTGARLALKVMNDRALANEAAVRRFRREARISSRIRSEHVVRVIDADVAPELQGAPYLVMELLEGQDLRRLCGDTPQPIEHVLEWLRQVARGLDKAHALGIVHRDLKPENLFLARRDDGTTLVKILDFGVAKTTFDIASSSAFSEIVGTPLFMAPEQVDLHGAPVTSRADLFALGLIAHRLITGRHYWSARLLLELAREICLQPMPPPSVRGSDLGPRFDEWFARACHRDPAHRFESASAQVEVLASALSPNFERASPSLSPFITAARASAPAWSRASAPARSRASAPPRSRASALRVVALATTLASGVAVSWSASRRVLAPADAPVPTAAAARASVSAEPAPAAPSPEDAASSARAKTASPSGASAAVALPALPAASARRHVAAIGPAVSVVAAPPSPPAVSSALAPVEPVAPARRVLDPFADQH